MKLPRTAAFEVQRQQFNMRFECEDCACFDPRDQTCAHRYPTLEHRAQSDDHGHRLLVFCKEFEVA